MADILDDDVPGFKTSYLGNAPEVKTGVTVRAPTSAEMEKINKSAPDVGNLQPDLKERVDALRDLWKADKVLNPKGEDLPITSGFRTLEQQREEYKNRLKNPNLVAPPGSSRHEKGDALDIHPRVPNSLLEQVGLHRPYGAKDPVHVEINPNIEWNAKPYDVEADTEVPGFQFKYNPKKVTAAEELGNFFEEAKQFPKTFAKRAASTADVALNVLPGVAQWALHPAAALADKFIGEQTEDQRTKLAKAAEDFSNPIGRAFGLLNDPEYKGEGARQIMDYVGEHADKGADWISENTGMDKRDAQWWINAAAMKAAPTVGKGVVKVAEQIPNVGKGLANTVAATLGATTGVGGDTVKEAFKAGLYNRPEFWENLTGKANKTQVLQDAHEALQVMRNERLGTYSDDALKVFDSPRIEAGKPLPKPQRLNFKPIDDAMKKMWESLQEHGEKGVKYNIGKEELAKVQEVQNIINEWRSDPSLHTVRGMDALKRRIDATYTENPKHGNAQRVITGMRNAVKNEIITEVPEYEQLMKNYEDSLELEKEIERTLSLGKNANPETALRKLQSVTRNNVNTSYGYRGDLTRELEQRTGKNLISALSGQAMSTIQPRGLAGLNPIATLGAAYGLNPYALATLPTESPALVGALTYGAGKAVRKAGQMKTKLSEITSRK